MQIKVDEDLPRQAVVVLRENGYQADSVVELIERVLQSYDLNSLAGTTTVVTPRGVRVRKSI